MPQMAPIMWLSLFIVFSLSFMIFNVINYFNLTMMIKPNIFMKKMNQNQLNWKW